MSKILFFLVFIVVVIGAYINYDRKSEYGLISGIGGYMINQECQRQFGQSVNKQLTELFIIKRISRKDCNCIAVHASRKLSIKEIAKMVDPQVRQQRVREFTVSQARVCKIRLQHY